MTSRARALVPDLQRCIDSNRDLAEQLYVLVQTNVEHVSLRDHRQMLKHCRCILDYLFSVISNAGQTLPQHDMEQFSQMLRSCEIDQELVSERLLEIEKLPAFAPILSAVPRDKRSWVSNYHQKGYFLSQWLKETPVVFSSRDEEGTYKPKEQGQKLQTAAKSEGPPPDAPKGPAIMDPTRRTATSGIYKPPLSASQAANLAHNVMPPRGNPIPQPVSLQSSPVPPLLDNEAQQESEASGVGSSVDCNTSTRSSSIKDESAPDGEAAQSADIRSPDTTQPTSSQGTKRKRKRARRGKGSSTVELVSRGETPTSAAILSPENAPSTIPRTKRRRRGQQSRAHLSEQLTAINLTTDSSKRRVSEEMDDSGTSQQVRRPRMEDLTESQQGQGQNQEPTSQDPVPSSPLRRYRGKKHLTQEELASLKAYTLDLLRDLQAEAGRGAPVNVSAPEAKPTSRRLKAEDFF